MEIHNREFWDADSARCTVVFKWTGVYAGFFKDDYLFDQFGRYLGWRDADGTVWKYDGEWLGQVSEQCYLARDSRLPPRRRVPPVPPVPAEPPMPPANRIRKLPRPGWLDPLEELLRFPTPEELIGVWWQDAQRVELRADGEFTWTVSPTHETTGRWELRGSLLFLRRWLEGELEVVPAYRIIEFKGDELLLRWLATDQRTLPFWLRRAEPLPAGS